MFQQEPWKVEKAPRRLAVISSPLWIAGIRLLHNSERYEVKYESERHLRTIGAKLAQFCEVNDGAVSCSTKFPLIQSNLA